MVRIGAPGASVVCLCVKSVRCEKRDVSADFLLVLFSGINDRGSHIPKEGVLGH